MSERAQSVRKTLFSPPSSLLLVIARVRETYHHIHKTPLVPPHCSYFIVCNTAISDNRARWLPFFRWCSQLSIHLLLSITTTKYKQENGNTRNERASTPYSGSDLFCPVYSSTPSTPLLCWMWIAHRQQKRKQVSRTKIKKNKKILTRIW